MTTTREAMIWVTLEDEKWRHENGFHPSTNSALGISPTQWAKHCRALVEEVAKASGEPGGLLFQVEPKLK